MKVDGDFFLRRARTEGEVRLKDVNIEGQLACVWAIFTNPKGVAFNAEGLTTKHDVFLDTIHASGEVRVLGAWVGSDLSCTGAILDDSGGIAFNAERLSIENVLFLHGMKVITGMVNLRAARVAQLMDNSTSWPKDSGLLLDGFEYNAFAGHGTPISAEERLRWIRLQPPKPFHPQPYEQLAAVFRRMGYETEAQKVLIAKQDDLRKYGNLPLFSKCWKWLLSWTIGYGYRPEQAWRPFLFLLLFGWGIFSLAARHGILRPTGETTLVSPDKHPILFSFAYSLDVLLPVVNLHQKNGWLPDRSKPGGLWITLYFWLHIALGWIFSALLVAALTGLVHTD